MSTANTAEKFSKSDNYIITELRDPNKRAGRLKLARVLLICCSVSAVVCFAIAQIMIFVTLYGQLYKDEALFFWATPFAMMFLGLSILMFFLSLKEYADVKTIHVYEALAQDQSVGSEM